MAGNHETPGKNPKKLINKNLTNCDSPFRFLPNFSTPPSKFAEIRNPFEQHVIERLHLPTFSPSVFARQSTPETDEKFRWSIEEISSLKPANIDECTVSQHVQDSDPKIESLVQEKIDRFFSEKSIVPSPLNEISRTNLVPNCSSPIPEEDEFIVDTNNAWTQTVLSLPAKLPVHVEKALAPYFNFVQDQKHQKNYYDSSLYKKLFEFENSEHDISHSSRHTSPALSTGLSPIQFSPPCSKSGQFDSPSSLTDIVELRDCNLSPIQCRSSSDIRPKALATNHSDCHMSIDENSAAVPDWQNENSFDVSNTTMNWDVEYREVVVERFIDESVTHTPHTKQFTSQRKRLSDSIRDMERCTEIEDDCRSARSRLFGDDVTDCGYHTGSNVYCEASDMDLIEKD